MQWEYRVFDCVNQSAPQIEAKLHRYGLAGWELVGFIKINEATVRICLKRPKEDRSNPYAENS